MNHLEVPYYLISAFSGPKAGGNPAAIILAREALPEEVMQAWARTLMQPATTFLWPKAEAGKYRIQWYAPDAQIPLCGHGAVAAAAALWEVQGAQKLTLAYENGTLTVGTDGARQYAWLPAMMPEAGPAHSGLEKALGVPVKGYFPSSGKHVVLVDKPETVAAMKPNFAALAELPPFSYAVTAAGRREDFVSRTLVPKVWQKEDQATGSSHATLVPFWGQRLGKHDLQGRQLSPRGGWVKGEWKGNQVRLWSQSRVLVKGHLIL
jgi:PhzF family phenazine biosynthesis protein